MGRRKWTIKVAFVQVALLAVSLSPAVASTCSERYLENPQIRRFYLFRHGETHWNALGKFHGQKDIPLNEKGKSQAQSLIPLLSSEGLELVVVSDLKRAAETGEIVASSLGLAVEKEPGIKESSLGESEGMTRPEVIEKYGVELQRAWRSNHPSDWNVRFPGGESPNEVQRRAFAAFERVMKAFPSFRRFAVATHADVIRRILQRIATPEQQPDEIHNGQVFVVEYDPTSDSWRYLNQAD